jgi:hypothetical protein
MKRTLILSALVLALTVLLVGFGSGNGAITTDPEISAILTNINPNNIFNTAQTLQNFRTRQSCSDSSRPVRVSARPVTTFLPAIVQFPGYKFVSIPLFMPTVRQPPPSMSLLGYLVVIPIDW